MGERPDPDLARSPGLFLSDCAEPRLFQRVARLPAIAANRLGCSPQTTIVVHNCLAGTPSKASSLDDLGVLPAIDRVLTRGGGALSRRSLLTVVGRSAFDHEVRRGHLLRLAPGVYARPWSSGDPGVHDVAALRYAGPASALSHVSALRHHELLSHQSHKLLDQQSRELLDQQPHEVLGQQSHKMLDQQPHEVHVLLADAGRGLRGVHANGHLIAIVVHRSRRKVTTVVRSGMPCVAPAAALIQSWPLLSASRGRSAMITAVRRGVVSTTELSREIALTRQLNHRGRLRDLLTLLDAGCESELEIWGYRSVFAIPELAGGRWQYPVRTRAGLYRVDLAFAHVKLAVELDGRAYHASPEQWERDIARDTHLATEGWQTVRLSHRRLTQEPHSCQRDVVAVLHRRELQTTVRPTDLPSAR